MNSILKKYKLVALKIKKFLRCVLALKPDTVFFSTDVRKVNDEFQIKTLIQVGVAGGGGGGGGGLYWEICLPFKSIFKTPLQFDFHFAKRQLFF